VYITNSDAIAKTGGTINGSEAADPNTAVGGGPEVYIDMTAPFARKTSLTANLTKAAGNTGALPAQDDTGANGSASAISTELTFTFGAAVSGLEAANIGVSSPSITLGAPTSSDNIVWTVPITTQMRGRISTAVDFPGVTLNPFTNIQIFNPNPNLAEFTIERAGETSALEDSTAIKIVFDRELDDEYGAFAVLSTAATAEIMLTQRPITPQQCFP
jgi:hypothetical protein